MEARHDLLWEQNRDRANIVSLAAIKRTMDRCEVPDRTEAQEVEWCVGGGRSGAS